MALESILICNGECIEVDNRMVFPNPLSDRMYELDWNMRHNPNHQLLHSDLMYLASVLCAYREIVIHKTQKSRNDCCAAIKKAALLTQLT